MSITKKKIANSDQTLVQYISYVVVENKNIPAAKL